MPAAWITQLQPDGLALVHIEGPLGAGNLLAQLHLPPGVLRSLWRREPGDGDEGATVTELRAPDGSWAEVTREPDRKARYRVREAGPTPLWAHVETAWEQWAGLGAPQWHQFGLTATPTRHTIWFRGPDGPNWPLPVPVDTAAPPPRYLLAEHTASTR